MRPTLHLRQARPVLQQLREGLGDGRQHVDNITVSSGKHRQCASEPVVRPGHLHAQTRSRRHGAAAPARSHDISSLPAQVVEKARSGQHFYTLSDFLPNRAPDASAASSSPLDSNAFILRFNASGEALTTSTADPAEIASIAKRKRQVSSFAEIAEVFFFSLISVIYLGRPDIQEQLVGLLSLANDISRQYGLPTALTYVDVIRRRHFQSYAPRTHVLLIDTNFDMARLHQDVLLDTIATIRLRDSNPSGAHSSEAAGRSADPAKSVGPCRNFNRGHPCFKDPCPFAHTCSTCNRGGHGSSACTQGGGRPAQPTQQAAGGTPSSSSGGRSAIAVAAATRPNAVHRPRPTTQLRQAPCPADDRRL